MFDDEEIQLQGFPICPGVAIGTPFFFHLQEENVPEFSVPDHEIDREIDRYKVALKHSRQDVLTLQEQLVDEGAEESAAILSSHLEMMQDPLMIERVEEEIRTKGKNTEYVIYTVMNDYEKKFNKVDNRIIKERLKDIHDISRRIIGHLRQKKRLSLASIPQHSIVFAHELSPSDTAEANTKRIEAFVTRIGSETSHVAIMARAKGIPFVANINFPDFFPLSSVKVIVDGRSGTVILNPMEATVEYYKKEQKKIVNKAKGKMKLKNLKAETTDGCVVHVSANIELANDVDQLQFNEGDGIGLFRSEYIFLLKDAFPSEEEQLSIYRSIVERMNGKPVVIRTFDIGGDKFGSFHPNRFEINPFLGCRATRFMLKEKSAFKTQIRAILRASYYGSVSILFPLISGLSELRQVKEILDEVKRELAENNVPFSASMPIGCMIEVPSAAMTIDLISKECDFLSIGTNDLVQYALAVDRGNPSMGYLYNPYHPSVIRLIKLIVDEASRNKKPVSICGEIAANPIFTPLLVGLGIHELSVASRYIHNIKAAVRSFSIKEAEELARLILSMETEKEIETTLVEFSKKIIK